MKTTDLKIELLKTGNTVIRGVIVMMTVWALTNPTVALSAGSQQCITTPSSILCRDSDGSMNVTPRHQEDDRQDNDQDDRN